jgi:tRNA threonylcarbamoyladenosine biosynthesis protein TsaB
VRPSASRQPRPFSLGGTAARRYLYRHMRILALEQSNRVGSVALLEEERVVLQKQWTDERFHSQQAFVALRDVLGEGQAAPATLDLFAVGLGPGSFAGLRMAVSALQALALPDGKEVFGVASGEALAWSVMRETGANTVVTIGDARRQRAWLARFRRRDDFLAQDGPWRLLAMEEARDGLVSGDLVVTPDWERLEKLLRQGLPTGVTSIEERRIPMAADVARVALEKRRRGLVSPPLTPVYLHPAVFVEPRFPG